MGTPNGGCRELIQGRQQDRNVEIPPTGMAILAAGLGKKIDDIQQALNDEFLTALSGAESVSNTK